MKRQNRAAVLYGVEDLRVEDIEMPAVGPRQVLVEVHKVGICGSDIHFFQHGSIGPFVVEKPMVVGHEPFGVVAGVGSEVSRLVVGTRVVLEPGTPCGACRECRLGSYNLCQDVAFFSVPPTNGAMARYVAVHEDFAHPVPDDLSDEAATMVEPLTVALWATLAIGVTPGSSVLITGAGPIGLMALQTARAAGATQVAVADVRETALTHARRLGATETINLSETKLEELGTEPDYFIECSGNAAAIRDGIYRLRPRGKAVLVGVGPEEVAVPVARIRRFELWLTATFRYANCYPQSIALAASGKIDFSGLVTDRYHLEDAPLAYARALDARRAGTDHHTIKAVIDVR